MTDAQSLAPWPAYTQRQASSKLGVPISYLDALANNPIPAVRVATPKGGTILLFQRKAVQKLASALKGTILPGDEDGSSH